MSSARVPAAPSSPLLRSVAVASALACAVVVGSVMPGAVASADERSGTTVVGELVHAWPDDEHAGTAEPHQDHGPLAWVETATGDAVRVPVGDVAGIAAGSTVEVTLGGQVEDEAGEDGFELARAVLSADVIDAPVSAAVRPDAAGLTNQVTVVLVTPQGVARDGVTEQQVVSAVDGPVADFWAEQTRGAVRLGVTASRGWTSTVAACSDPAALWNEVADTVGFVAGPGRHLMLYVSDAAEACSYALAEVGASTSTGGRLYVRDTIASLIAHEFGHNFGLGHSSGRQCDGTVESGSCRTAAYRDLYDVMGFSWDALGSLNAAHAAQLGVLPTGEQQSVLAGGVPSTVTLAPLAGRAGLRALRLVGGDGVVHWLEYRAATGRDDWLATAGNRYRLETGVLLRRADAFPDTSLLLDGTPSPAGRWDADLRAALPLGTAVTVSGGDFVVVVEQVSAAGAVVSVTPSTAERTPPSASAVLPAPGGTVMSGTSGRRGAAATAEGAAAAGVPAADVAPAVGVPADVAGAEMSSPDVVTSVHSAPTVEAAAQTGTASGLAVPAAGILLAGVVLLMSGLLRRSQRRHR